MRQEIFERAGFDRLKLLHQLGTSPPTPANLDILGYDADPVADTVGHFVLRLALSTVDPLSQWLVTREVVLLQQRWAKLARVEHDRALTLLGVTLGEERPGLSMYQLPFTQVPPRWVAERRVVLKRGVAHVAGCDTCALASHLFDVRLRNSMQDAARAMQSREHRPLLEIVMPLLERLRRHAEGLLTPPPATSPRLWNRSIVGDDVGLALDNFEEMRMSFPPCMQHVILHQRTGQRLRFQGLLQLRPFLRKAGLDLPSALQWFETELRRDGHVTEEVFEREHRYQVEHAYGARGHGRGAHPFGCASIQRFPLPESGQVNGCPFQRGHESPYNLATLLGHWGLAQEGVDAVVRAAREGPPSRACAVFSARRTRGRAGADMEPSVIQTITFGAAGWRGPRAGVAPPLTLPRRDQRAMPAL